MPELCRCGAPADYAVWHVWHHDTPPTVQLRCATCAARFLSEAAQVKHSRPAFKAKGKNVTVKYTPLEGGNE